MNTQKLIEALSAEYRRVHEEDPPAGFGAHVEALSGSMSGPYRVSLVELMRDLESEKADSETVSELWELLSQYDQRFALVG